MQARIDRLLARCEATEGFQDDYRRLQQDLRDAHQHTLSLVAGSQRDAIWNEKERAEAASRLAGPLKEVARLRELVRRYDSALARASHLTTSEMVSVHQCSDLFPETHVDLFFPFLAALSTTVPRYDLNQDLGVRRLPSFGWCVSRLLLYLHR